MSGCQCPCARSRCPALLWTPCAEPAGVALSARSAPSLARWPVGSGVGSGVGAWPGCRCGAHIGPGGSRAGPHPAGFAVCPVGAWGRVFAAKSTPELTGSRRGPGPLVVELEPQFPHAASLRVGSHRSRAGPSACWPQDPVTF